MAILVTGAAGFVGNNVVRTLRDAGRQVRALVRSQADPRPLAGLGVEVVVGDISDPTALARACAGVTGVIHAAALVHIGWKRLAEQRAVNVDGTRHVATAARLSGARMVHVSSVDALGIGSKAEPANEDTPRQGNPPCGYVVTKQESERVVREEIAAGLEAVIVNPGFMLGPWDWKPSSARMFLEVTQRRPLMAARGGGSVCDVRDVARAIVAALDRATTGSQYILAGWNIPYVELWRKFAQQAGTRPPLCRAGPLVCLVAGRLGDVNAWWTGRESDLNSATVAMSNLNHYYSSARAARDLDYQVRPLDETIADTWRWLVEYGYVERSSAASPR